ncbi:MAG TPA: hypothetical protein VFH85_02990 [Gammaproteobacteria bacterium]|nr:hypothetical protein [Gammaproteobacteria bacterium]
MKKYGIRLTMPEDDPMRAEHLLGPNWESCKWFQSEKERDEAFVQMRREHLYSRRGDIPSIVPEKIET